MLRRGALAICAATLILQALCALPAAAAEKQFREEDSRQTEIYQSRGQNVPQGYVIDRSLLSYAYVLPAEFAKALAALEPRDRWLDIGAGEGRAILDYQIGRYDAMIRSRNGKAQAVAMSIEDRRTPRWHEMAAALDPGRIDYLAGRRLREYAPAELGRFQLISDVLGGFSYTERLSVFVERVLHALEPNGSFFTLLQDVRSHEGGNRPFYPDSSFLTEIQGSDGRPVGVCAWLKRIACAEVTCEFKPQSTPPTEVYRVKKVCEAVSVPPLELVHFAAGTPPERRFRIVEKARP